MFQVIWKMNPFQCLFFSFLLCNVSMTRRVSRHTYEILVLMFFLCRMRGKRSDAPKSIIPGWLTLRKESVGI